MKPEQIPKIIRQVRVRDRKKAPLFTFKDDIVFDPPTSATIIKVLFFSVDPVMYVWLSGARSNFRQTQIGQVFNCFGLGIVVREGSDDKGKGYSEGTYLFGNTGTTQYLVLSKQNQFQLTIMPTQLVTMVGPEKFLYLINNGLVAFQGFNIINPKAGETVVVSTAAGATGLLVCHLVLKAKADVIALTSAKKIEPLRKIFPGLKEIMNYQETGKLEETLKNTTFQGYYDNVGQQQLEIVIQNIEAEGQIALCGATAGYTKSQDNGIRNSSLIFEKRLKLHGVNFGSQIQDALKIFPLFKEATFLINYVGMSELEESFTSLLRSGGGQLGKIIVDVSRGWPKIEPKM